MRYAICDMRSDSYYEIVGGIGALGLCLFSIYDILLLSSVTIYILLFYTLAN